MKILILNCVYQEGSTGKIVAALSEELRTMGHIVLTCYGLGKEHYDDFSKNICTTAEHKVNAVIKRLTGITQGGIYYSNTKIKDIIREFQPDVVHIHSANPSVYNVHRLLKYLANADVKTVFTLHAEIAHTAGCEHAFDCNKWKEGCHDCPIYKKKVGSWFFDRSRSSYNRMFKAINAFRKDRLTITAVSPWLADRASQSVIMRNYNIVYVPNGVDVSIFHHRDNEGLIDRATYQKVILFVTPYLTMDETDNKGGRFIPQLASALPSFKFIVVASRNIGEISNMPNNVQLWGKAKSQEELAQLYSEADMTLILSHRETFSMVTAETLCCGTPVVGFSAGGPETISLSEYSKFVEYGNVEGIINALKVTKGIYDKNIVSQQARETYSKLIMAQRYFDVYQSISEHL